MLLLWPTPLAPGPLRLAPVSLISMVAMPSDVKSTEFGGGGKGAWG